MKKVDIIIRPHKLEDVRDALTAVGVQGVTVTEMYRGNEYSITFNPKVHLEVLIPDTMLEQTMQAAGEAARTGRIGDGKIMVTDVLDVVRIRTGETGNAAI